MTTLEQKGKQIIFPLRKAMPSSTFANDRTPAKNIDLKQLSKRLTDINLNVGSPNGASSPVSSLTSSPGPLNNLPNKQLSFTKPSTQLDSAIKVLIRDAECLIDSQEWPNYAHDLQPFLKGNDILRPLHLTQLSDRFLLLRQEHETSPDEAPALSHSRIKELRVAVIGNVDAGKSTLLAVLSRGKLDDGRGGARLACNRHRHESETGRTSSVNQELLGFKIDGSCMYTGHFSASKETVAAVNTLSHAAKMEWEAWIGRGSWKCVSLIDLAGHERYLKTTMFGLTGFCPDLAILLVAANAGGLIGTSREHLALVSALSLPMIVVITKVDLAPAPVHQATLAAVMKAIRSSPCKKNPLLLKGPGDVLELMYSGLFGANQVCPVVEVSNVTGEGIDLLRLLLNLASPPDAIRKKWEASINGPLEYQINETYTVPGVGTVVSGVMLGGRVHVGDQVMLGPLAGSGGFLSSQIRGIQRKRVSLDEAVAGQGVSFALKRIRRSEIRYGMMLIGPEDSRVRACREFTAQVMILYHSTTITPKYQAMLHCGSIRQTVQIVSMELCNTNNNTTNNTSNAANDEASAVPVGRSGDRARIRFRFLKNPEIMQVGAKVLFREGRIRGIGKVIEVHHNEK